MSRKGIILGTALALVFVGVSFMKAQDKGPKSADRESDKQAIDALIKASAQAFDNRDAAAMAANWTAEGEYFRNNGEAVRGRAEIQKGYAEFFKTLKGKTSLEVQKDSLRFTSADSALSQDTLRLKNEQGELIASIWRNTMLVREGGQWKVALVQEWDRDTGFDDSLADLTWLIGTWKMASDCGTVTTTYEWDENKKFIRGKYEMKEGDKITESGMQMIGKDNADGGIRSWVFQSDGGFGGGLWTREGKNWNIDFYGVTPEGKKLTATVIYVHVDPNTFTWQSVDQAVDDQSIPNSKPLKVTRQKASR